MKAIVVILMMFCVGFAYPQDNKVKYEQNGDLVEATFYYDNGEIEQHGFFKDKKLHGTWTYFNEEGEKVAVGTYENGKKVGKWFFYSEEGVREVDYDNQKVVSIN